MDCGICLLIQLVALGLQIHTNEGLERSAIVNENCTRYITSQYEDLTLKTSCANYYGNNSQFGGAEYSQSTNSGEIMCPPWYQRNGAIKCETGAHFEGIVKSEKHMMQTLLQTFYCMTTSYDNGTNRSDVIGSCLFSYVTQVVQIYYPLPCNISKLNKYTCAGLNREGQLCGRCMKGFAPPVYSYTLNCVNCTDYHLNWLKYIHWSSIWSTDCVLPNDMYLSHQCHFSIPTWFHFLQSNYDYANYSTNGRKHRWIQKSKL